MNYINAKTSADHSGTNTITNNGGIVVICGMGATPAEKVGEKTTTTPEINRAVVNPRANADTWPPVSGII
jgi:hypothetical protein